MRKYSWVLITIAVGAFGQSGKVPTFSKEVAPILQKHCQSCHRPGEAGPFPLLTYEEARPWAAAIREAVIRKQMPPWFADPRYGSFSNGGSLTTKEIDTIAAWASGKAPRGDPRDLPPPLHFEEGWGIGKPDQVFELPAPYEVPERGVVEYQHVIVPTNFTEDRWVQAAEVRPTDRAVVHHIIAFIREPQSTWFRGQQRGVFFIAPQVKTKEAPDPSGLPGDCLVGYAPGRPAEILRPGEGKLIKAGSDIIFQVHYTPNGRAVKDRTKLGIVFAPQPPPRRVLTLSATNGVFRIPPGAPNHRVDATFELGAAADLAGMHPHMHGRGKDFRYRLVFPNGESQTILDVPRYNWHWQNWYTLERPIALPKGTRIECTAHFDNSANNPDNADPSREVLWGEQSWEEMMVGFFNLVFDAKLPVKELLGGRSRADIASR